MGPMNEEVLLTTPHNPRFSCSSFPFSAELFDAYNHHLMC
jgi:hypothetical protein